MNIKKNFNYLFILFSSFLRRKKNQAKQFLRFPPRLTLIFFFPIFISDFFLRKIIKKKKVVIKREKREFYLGYVVNMAEMDVLQSKIIQQSEC
jgi:hypothetical protein